jgi:hypothetical protein
MKKAFYLIALLFLPLSVFAQQTVPIKVGDTIPDERFQEMWQRLARAYSPFIGMPLPNFVATWNGRLMNNATMKGDVYLLAFWTTDCNCFDVTKLLPLNAVAVKHKDFHVVSILPDTAYMYLCKPCQVSPFNYAITSNYRQHWELSLKNGIPLYIIVNRAGIIVKIIPPHDLDKPNGEGYLALAKSIEELLLF